MVDMESRYRRITLADGTWFFLRITGETDRFLTGIEVAKDGEPVAGKGFDERLRVIEKAMLAKTVPYRMNNMYAILERVTK
jgi:hypothetical protein